MTTQAAIRVTADSVDPDYAEPFVDIDEQRAEPVPHRYVSGGFKGTDARFSFYFPPQAQYQGRFFHNTYPMAISSDVGPFPIQFEVAVGDIGFTLDSGAYYVQTNNGLVFRNPGADPAIAAYRVNAAAAKFSRKVAADIYGEHRPYGYLFGGSGGSYQVMGSAENTTGVWDGFVPFVIGCPHAIPSMFTVRMNALRVLKQRGRFAAVMDAIDPGGDGDPYATLNEEEAGALREATRMGYPPRGWWSHATLTSGYFSTVAPLVPMFDPTYLEDFWSQPGYLGADPASSIHAARFTFETSVAEVVEGPPRRIVLTEVPTRDIANAHLVVQSGDAAGKGIAIAEVDGRTVGFAMASDPKAIAALKPGDRLTIDNAWPLAIETYHRHQVPGPEFCGWDQFRGPDGTPTYPQRGLLIGPIGAGATAGAPIEGRIHGKVLVVEAMMDIDALPWQADWYRSAVKAALGDRFDDSFALWFIDHAQHDDPQTLAAHAHTVSFSGALQQALRDIALWAEQGIKPAETRYAIEDAQVKVPAGAEARGGVQPVAALTVDGGVRAEIAVGRPVTLEAVIDTPPGMGAVVSAEWDFEGEGTYPLKADIGTAKPHVTITATHAYDKPGTYFPVVRVAAQREADPLTPYGRVLNLARARVVVK